MISVYYTHEGGECERSKPHHAALFTCQTKTAHKQQQTTISWCCSYRSYRQHFCLHHRGGALQGAYHDPYGTVHLPTRHLHPQNASARTNVSMRQSCNGRPPARPYVRASSVLAANLARATRYTKPNTKSGSEIGLQGNVIRLSSYEICSSD